MAIARRHEVQVGHVRRICRGSEAGDAWRRYRTGRQTLVHVGVVRRVDSEVPVEHATDVVAERVLHGRIRLQQHPSLESVVVDSGDHRSLFGETGFSLDDRGHRHQVVAIDLEVGGAGIPLRTPATLERIDHLAHGLPRRGANGERVGVREEIALECFVGQVEARQQCGVARRRAH